MAAATPLHENLPKFEYRRLSAHLLDQRNDLKQQLEQLKKKHEEALSFCQELAGHLQQTTEEKNAALKDLALCHQELEWLAQTNSDLLAEEEKTNGIAERCRELEKENAHVKAKLEKGKLDNDNLRRARRKDREEFEKRRRADQRYKRKVEEDFAALRRRVRRCVG